MVYLKNLINTFDTGAAKVGLFTNDLFFFTFELFFIFSIVVLLIFFVFISNVRGHSGFLSVCASLVNILYFVIILLIFFLLNSSNILSNYTGFYIFNGFYYDDLFSVFFKLVSLLFFFFFLILLKNNLRVVKNYDFEFIIILLVSLFSSVLLVNSNDLVSLFFIIELQSLSFYILVASKQTSSFSTEGGLKYFILGSFSSGVMLFGISLIYGFTGLLSYSDLSIFCLALSTIPTDSFLLPTYGFVIGLIFLSVGLLFKLGAVPFHMWMPDVYEGSPFLIMTYLSTIPKISLFFIYFKLYYSVFFHMFYYCQLLFFVSSALSIMIGSVAAIYQIKIKRLLTYSMITNSGYLLLGLSLGGSSGIWVTLFYLLSYIFIMFGLFACISVLRNASSGFMAKKITAVSNLFEINPALAFSILILVFSIAGVPPLLGFYGKLFLFMFALKLKLYWLVIFFVVFSTISVFYYIRLAKIMYFNRTSGWFFLKNIPFSVASLISFIVIVNCIFFLFPNFFLELIYTYTFYFFI